MSPEFIAYNFNDLLNVQWLKWEQQHPPANLPLKIHCIRGFPGYPVVKDLPANAENMGLIPGPGTKIPHTLG